MCAARISPIGNRLPGHCGGVELLHTGACSTITSVINLFIESVALFVQRQKCRKLTMIKQVVLL